MKLPALRPEEIVTLKLRALFEEKGYRLYRMSSFEEYDLYMQHKSFLTGDDPIPFTGPDGRLMALMPDVTISIVKNTPAGERRKVYYNENVYRSGGQSGEFKQIRQVGLEFIGGAGQQAEAEVLALAAAALGTVGQGALDLSHIEFIEAMLAPLGLGPWRSEAEQALQAKSAHGMGQAAVQAGLPEATANKLQQLATLSGPFEEAFALAEQLADGVPGTRRPLAELRQLYSSLRPHANGTEIRLDFSVRGDTDYYNGLLFQGFVRGVPAPVLAGGRYDNLLHRFGKPQGAVGFALTLDALERTAVAPTEGGAAATEQTEDDGMLSVALPKGRLGNQVYQLLEAAGLCRGGLLESGRKLVLEDKQNKLRFFLVKPSDVDSYVQYGAADIGVVGRDTLLESGADVLELADLGIGQCRLAVAGKADFAEDPALPLRVATKYPGVARRYYTERSRSVEIIQLHGSIELAPLLGLSDVIVDIVETGATLRENNLDVLAEVAPVSARLIANRGAWRFKGPRIQRMAAALTAQTPARAAKEEE